MSIAYFEINVFLIDDRLSKTFNILFNVKIKLSTQLNSTKCANTTLIDNIFTSMLSESHLSGIVLDDLSNRFLYRKSISHFQINIYCVNGNSISDLYYKLKDFDWST